MMKPVGPAAVRAYMLKTPARLPFVIHIFEPLSSQ